jgi:surface polysaccharide O-acyltransferase-like enzyme
MLEHFEFPSFIVNSIFVAYLTVLSSWLVAMLLKRIPGASRIL